MISLGIFVNWWEREVFMIGMPHELKVCKREEIVSESVIHIFD